MSEETWENAHSNIRKEVDLMTGFPTWFVNGGWAMFEKENYSNIPIPPENPSRGSMVSFSS